MIRTTTIAVALLLVLGVLGAGFVLLRTTTPPGGDDIASGQPLPMSGDRSIKSADVNPVDDGDDVVDDQGVGEMFAPGGVYETQPWQMELVQELQRKLQVDILHTSDYPAYIIDETEQYRAMLLVRDTEYMFDLLLKQEPLYEARMYAEASVAQAMGIERVDLCGFPAYVYIEAPHELAGAGNLGLAYCGADVLDRFE